MNIAVFSVFDRILFRPLPYASADRLVQIDSGTTRPDDKIAAALMPYEVSAVLERGSEFVEGVAWEEGSPEQIAPAPGESPLLLTAVSPNAFTLLGVQPILGRGFESDDTTGVGELAVILAYETWQSRFGSSQDAFSLRLGPRGRPFRIIGVLPRGFFFPSSLLAARRDGFFVHRRTGPMPTGWATVAPIARLRQGVSGVQLQSHLDVLLRTHPWTSPLLRRVSPDGMRLRVKPVRAGMSILVSPYLWLISVAVWIVLAVASTNLAILLLMRWRAGRYVAAVRIALGASSSRLVRLVMLEAAVLCVTGSAVSWVVFTWTRDWIVSVVPPAMRAFVVEPLDGRVLLATAGAALGSALLAGLIPALAVCRTSVSVELRPDRGAAGRRSWLNAGSALLLVETACAVVVVGGAAVTVPAFVQFLLTPAGFESKNLYTVTVGHHWASTGNVEALRAQRVKAILDVVRVVPHVASASAALTPPFVEPPEASGFWRRRGLDGRRWFIGEGMVSTVQSALLSGRDFSAEEVVAAAPVALLNETGARAVWPDEPMSSWVGRTIQTEAGPRVVVGIVRDIRNRPGTSAVPGLFLPITAREATPTQAGLPVIVRMAAGALPDANQLTARLDQVFPPNRVRITAVADELAPLLDRPRFLSVLFGVLGGTVLLLAAIGVYAVGAVEAVSRRKEVALRRALGASGVQACRRMVAGVIWPVVFGAAIGLTAASAAMRSVSGWVAEFGAIDARVHVLALLVVLGGCAIALWRPVRLALRVDLGRLLRES